MRRIAYWLNNKAYVDIILEFCEVEGLLAVDLSSQTDIAGHYVFFITDDKAKLAEYADLSPSRCLIDPEARFSHDYYILGEKFGLYSLRILMDYIHHGGTLWNTVRDLEFNVIYKELYVGNNLYDVEKLVCQLTWELLYFCTFSDVEKIRIGFSEMVTNAIEHGNLAITDKDKHEHTEAGTYNELLAERLADPTYSARKTRIIIDFKSRRLKISILDEGNGFDTSKFPSPQEPDALLKLHGRGILITKAYFDSVTYNQKGTEVTLTKVF